MENSWAVEVAAQQMGYKTFADVPNGLWNKLFDLADEIEGDDERE